jgi:hypothetical protein
MKTLLAFLAFFTCSLLFAQDTIVSQDVTILQDTTAPRHTHIVSMSLFKPLFAESPRWQFGYMRRISRRFWAGADVGYGNYAISLGANSREKEGFIGHKYQFFEIRPEFYYDIINEGLLECLISTELFYIHHTDTFSNDTYHTENGGSVEFSKADYKRVKAGINFNLTCLIAFNDNTGLILKAGAGIRLRNVKYSNVTVTNIDSDGDGWNLIDFGTDDYKKDEGKVTGGNADLDLKFFYRF